MKKSILKLGKALTKVEQKKVTGGIRECQQFIHGTTPQSCQSLNGHYFSDGRCLVTIPNCGPTLSYTSC
ncbi:hypothetical protein [Aquimarina spongiae]|uniref:Uncharacterized protein n=1 Tax=Aquimarina spongiae TaxID=570521 RepID=A0A1M6E4I0_9FLAO|nr:hypothetical protein [Aquimarina spongiae]SHI80444.1 hypothetical protein SAMN04488508_103213 [Aquimarina spongiae]